MDLELTRVSSKGQVVIPRLIRERLGLADRTKLLVFGEGDTIILKKVGLGSNNEEVLVSIRKKIKQVGTPRKDVAAGATRVRRAH